MASNGEQRMNERLGERPKLGLRWEEEEYEEEAEAGAVSGLVDRCVELSLVGGVEGGGFKIPGLNPGGSGGLAAGREAGSSGVAGAGLKEKGGSLQDGNGGGFAKARAILPHDGTGGDGGFGWKGGGNWWFEFDLGGIGMVSGMAVDGGNGERGGWRYDGGDVGGLNGIVKGGGCRVRVAGDGIDGVGGGNWGFWWCWGGDGIRVVWVKWDEGWTCGRRVGPAGLMLVGGGGEGGGGPLGPFD